MTLPDERYRAIMSTKMFLHELLNPELTPRVPKIIRQQASWCLRHYPTKYEMDQVAKQSPDIFQEKIEDVQRFMMQYEQGKKDETGL